MGGLRFNKQFDGIIEEDNEYYSSESDKSKSENEVVVGVAVGRAGTALASLGMPAVGPFELSGKLHEDTETRVPLEVEEVADEPERREGPTEESTRSNPLKNSKTRLSIPSLNDKDETVAQVRRDFKDGCRKPLAPKESALKRLGSAKDESSARGGLLEISANYRSNSSNSDPLKTKAKLGTFKQLSLLSKDARQAVKPTAKASHSLEEEPVVAKAWKKTDSHLFNKYLPKIRSQEVQDKVRVSAELRASDKGRRESGEQQGSRQAEKDTLWSNLKQKIITGSTAGFPKLFESTFQKPNSGSLGGLSNKPKSTFQKLFANDRL